MVYDTNNENHPHLRLPVPELRDLAASMTVGPSEEMQHHIKTVAQAMLEQADDAKVSPFRLHYEVHRNHPDVTIDQVASVLIAWLQIPRK